LPDQLSYYSVVNVLRSSSTAALGIDGLTGVIVGISESGPNVEYAVLVGDEVCMVKSSDVRTTGEAVSRSDLYGGNTLKVDPQQYPGGS
jgi:Immunity protein 31